MTAMVQQVVQLAAEERIQQVGIRQVAADGGQRDAHVTASRRRQRAAPGGGNARGRLADQCPYDGVGDVVHPASVEEKWRRKRGIPSMTGGRRAGSWMDAVGRIWIRRRSTTPMTACSAADPELGHRAHGL